MCVSTTTTTTKSKRKQKISKQKSFTTKILQMDQKPTTGEDKIPLVTKQKQSNSVSSSTTTTTFCYYYQQQCHPFVHLFICPSAIITKCSKRENPFVFFFCFVCLLLLCLAVHSQHSITGSLSTSSTQHPFIYLFIHQWGAYSAKHHLYKQSIIVNKHTSIFVRLRLEFCIEF